ncbi:MAG: YfjI family protein [Giesbergeria sp.]
MLNYSQEFFPIHAVPPLVRGAILEASAVANAPQSLAASVAFSTAALACQGHIRVRSPAGVLSPVSMFFLDVAKSGDRKTTVEKLFLSSIRDFQMAHQQRLLGALARARDQIAIWKVEAEALNKKLGSAICRGADTERLKEQLLNHAAKRPQEVRLPKLFYANTSPEALWFGLAKHWPSAILQSSEASTVLAGKMSQDFGALNSLWDGGEHVVDRRSGESFTLRDAKLSVSLMVQPGVMQKFLAKGDGHARDIGFLARCLVSAPTSLMGTRFLHNALKHETPYLNEFADAAHGLLNEYFSADDVLRVEPRVLQFESDAADAWLDFYNRVEGALAPGGYYSDISDFASKIAENAARMAAIFHAIEGKPGNLIDHESATSAVAVTTWYLNEFKRLLGEPQQLSDVHANSRILEVWLQEHCVRSGYRYQFLQRHIRTYGPNRLRDKKILGEALDQLARDQKLIIGKYNRQLCVSLNMQYFGHEYHLRQSHSQPLLLLRPSSGI